MIYSTDHRVNDLVLTIINDGDGKQCGMDYAKRCAAAETGLFDYRFACRSYSRYSHAHYGTPHATQAQIIAAADIVQEYYREHVTEIETTKGQA